MAVALSPNEFERTIEVLSNAGQTLQLTRFERFSYRALLLSVDALLVSFIVYIFLLYAGAPVGEDSSKQLGPWLSVLVDVPLAVLGLSVVVGLVSLALNIPLLLRTFREARKLKQLGLGSLSISLWKESRRSRRMSRIRGAALVGIGVIILVAVVISLAREEGRDTSTSFVELFIAMAAGLMLAARYLRNQRERMDLASSAEQLKKALLSLRQRKGPNVVSVPAELLEQTARIEAAQIGNERKDAVLQSAAFRPNAYAIAFSREAAGERAALGVEDRVELEDLVAELSTKGEPLESQAQPVPGTEGMTLLAATKSQRVEIEYVIEHASRGIRVTAVRPGAETSDAPLNGASHA
jgi:hypothetical protein